MKKIIVVADWSDDSLAREEFKLAIEGFLKDPLLVNVGFINSTPSTIHIAFLSAQIVDIIERLGRPLETVIFQNTDPILQFKGERNQAKGTDFTVMKLKSGIYVCGQNTGYSFSMIKAKIDELFIYNELNKETQSRSRDLYSRVCAHLMDAMEDELQLEEIYLDSIPDLKGFYVGHIDNFGNIKTTIKYEDFKGKYEYGDKVKIKINNIEKTPRFVNNLFETQSGELVMYLGSSGPKDNPFIEITVRQHFAGKKYDTGSDIFLNPLPGDEISILT